MCKDILPKNFARPELDKRRLGDVVDLFTNIQMVDHGNSKDILGRTYEYCLSKFAEQEGKLAGEFYTPSCVVRTLVEVLQPFNGRVYDPCCGSGGMFVQSAKFIENHGGNINKISVFGQDSNPTTWKMAQMNLSSLMLCARSFVGSLKLRAHNFRKVGNQIQNELRESIHTQKGNRSLV